MRRPSARPTARPATRRDARQSAQFNGGMLIASLITGALSWLVGLVIYNATVDVWPRPLVIGVMFGILAFFVLLSVFVISTIQGAFEENILTGGSTGSVLLIILVAVVLITALGMLFQWIYGLHYNNPQPWKYRQQEK